MHPTVHHYLTVILFLPWFAILGTLFWVLPRTPRDAARRWFDVIALAACVAAFVLSVDWAMGHAARDHGALWPQILAVSVGYGVFLAAITLAFLVRSRWLRTRADTQRTE